MIADLLRRATERAAERSLPESTYRLQFHTGFTFRDATRIVPYLRDLGVTHVYASPYLKARPGSTHGYDIVDHRVLNPEIGTAEDYDAWVAALAEHGLRQVLDIVPNHMGVATNENAWWNDVLENGPSSRYADYFDIAWYASTHPDLKDKVLLPILGDSYGAELEAGRLQLTFDGGAFWVTYYDRRLPLAPRSYALVLGHRAMELGARLGPESPDLAEYQSILTAIGHLPDRTETDPARRLERQREKEVVKRRLADLTARCEPVRDFIAENVAAFNGGPGDPASYDRLDDLLTHQSYRLAYWRVATDEINYRRFFDINDLAALSMEREEVFAAAHELVLGLLADGRLDGLRIDHPDGLYDPQQYFRRLQRYYLLALAKQAFDALPDAQGADWKDMAGPLAEQVEAALDQGSGPSRWPLYVVAEKILGAHEALPDEWAVHGTSGYDFVIAVNNLFVDPAAEYDFDRLYRDLAEAPARFSEVAYRCKRLILQVSLASELHMLARQLARLAQKGRRSRDLTLNSLRDALREVIASFPVYRSYISDAGLHATDRRHVEAAVRRAAIRNPLMGRPLFDFIRSMLLLDYPPGATEEDKAEQRRFAGKFQQVTSPVTAKGVEDTAFYRYNRLVSLNEVGGEPGRFGARPDAVHKFHADRQAKWPYALSPLSTHDTKRSEDVRARVNVLSELPGEWRDGLKRWTELNAAHRTVVEEAPAPDANEEYFIYQTLAGAWPLEPYPPEEFAAFVTRVQDYMVKVLHEAKVHSSWVNPRAEYDDAVRQFVARVLDPEGNREFHEAFAPFRRKVAHLGLLNSLAQTVLKITCPGVPDTYQGTEVWDFSLVDPDNRRPVNYDRRRELLDGLREHGDRRALASDLLRTLSDGRAKLYVTHHSLTCRRDRPRLFSAGEYVPLAATGPQADHVFSFARRSDAGAAVVVVPRLMARMGVPDGGLPLGTDVWGETRVGLPAGDGRARWRNVFTDERLAAGDGPGLAAADVFAHFPVAVLVRET